jgi:hypothetical protein
MTTRNHNAKEATMKAIITREMAAEALDKTIHLGDTKSRDIVAEWLDKGGTVTKKIRTSVQWVVFMASREEG